jgi:hypothetical protein
MSELKSMQAFFMFDRPAPGASAAFARPRMEVCYGMGGPARSMPQVSKASA